MAETPPKSTASRREVLGLTIIGAATTVTVATAYPLLRFVAPAVRGSASQVVIAKVDKFIRGTARYGLLGPLPIVVVRLADGSFRAFESRCSHLLGIVEYDEQRQGFECHCHRGRYAIDGSCVAGPPTEPLRSLTVQQVDGAVVVSAT